jgi:F-type H+-transporting ATPase subunit b
MLTFPPDYSFVIQIFSFLVLWFGLKHLLFDPVVHVLEQREARTSGTRRAAAEIRAAAEAAAAAYERDLHKVRVDLAADTEAARQSTQEQERRVVGEARGEASRQLMQVRETLRQQAETVRPALAAEARDLSARMLQRVLGRSVA